MDNTSVSQQPDTAQTETESTFIQNEERYKIYLENVSDAIFIIRLPADVIQYASPSCQRVLGYEVNEMVGSKGADYVHPDDRNDVFHALSEGATHPGLTLHLLLRFKHKDGSWRVLSCTGKVIPNKDQTVDAVISALDITQQKIAEEELRKQKEETDRLNSLMIGRELKMVEMKKEIDELKAKLSNP